MPAPISNIVRVFQFDEPIVEAMRNKRANALSERSKKTAVADLNQFPSNKAVRITLPNVVVVEFESEAPECFAFMLVNRQGEAA